jgi:hypothetical protein
VGDHARCDDLASGTCASTEQKSRDQAGSSGRALDLTEACFSRCLEQDLLLKAADRRERPTQDRALSRSELSVNERLALISRRVAAVLERSRPCALVFLTNGIARS